MTKKRSMKISSVILVVGLLSSTALFLLNLKAGERSGIEDAVKNDYVTHGISFVKVANDLILKARNSKENIHYSKLDYDKNDNNLNLVFSLGYHAIHSANGNEIYFIRDSYFGFFHGLVYSSNGLPPSSQYLTELVHLSDHWYLFKMK